VKKVKIVNRENLEKSKKAGVEIPTPPTHSNSFDFSTLSTLF
jgi:hypothetical protein